MSSSLALFATKDVGLNAKPSCTKKKMLALMLLLYLMKSTQTKNGDHLELV